MEKNPRYLWLGEQPRWRTRRILARSHLCVLSSRMEGGANALSESIVASVPVVASRIPGTVGILGEDYPGYFNVGDTRELRRLLIRAEADPDFLSLLRSKCDELAGLFEPEREQKAWKDLLGELRRPGSSVQRRNKIAKNVRRICSRPVMVGRVTSNHTSVVRH